MRDKLKSYMYFQEYIDEEEKRINKFNTKLKNSEVREDRIFPVEKEINATRFGMFIARYSMGEDIIETRNEFLNMIYDMPKFWNPISGYIKMLWMISIAIMYEIEDEPWSILVTLVKESQLNDWLIEYLIASRDNSVKISTEKFRMQEPYKNIRDIVHSDTDIDKMKKLKDYLADKWYNAHHEMGWYDIHKSKEKLYYGYWSFESGAIVKILGLDDTELKDVPYYPYDMVHFTDHK